MSLQEKIWKYHSKNILLSYQTIILKFNLKSHILTAFVLQLKNKIQRYSLQCSQFGKEKYELEMVRKSMLQT